MRIFTKTAVDGSYLESVDSFFDPALASNFEVDKDEKVITFDYDIAECGDSLNLPLSSLVVSAKFIVRVTPTGIHVGILASYTIDEKSGIKKYADECGIVEYNARLDDYAGTDEEKLLLYCIACNLLNK